MRLVETLIAIAEKIEHIAPAQIVAIGLAMFFP